MKSIALTQPPTCRQWTNSPGIMSSCQMLTRYVFSSIASICTRLYFHSCESIFCYLFSKYRFWILFFCWFVCVWQSPKTLFKVVFFSHPFLLNWTLFSMNHERTFRLRKKVHSTSKRISHTCPIYPSFWPFFDIEIENTYTPDTALCTRKKHTIRMHIALIRSHYFAVICCALFAVHVYNETNKKLITFQCFVFFFVVALLFGSISLSLSHSLPQITFVGGLYAHITKILLLFIV